ncbi:peroxiredoxin-like family protein [Arthrobacter sp. B1805]|uniref:peroxiredoxin-like family protein n=1 Tax=Arthrobacter sp. B1805 TaxID=2058892 RepID=UPI000CE5414D|nr:peroxiredoxin-like family protein [Arthrobacter sp. B1805]
MSSVSIESQVAEFNQDFEAQIGPVLAATFAQEQADLRTAGTPDAVASAGEKLPDATLLTRRNELVRLSEVLASSPAVLVFYRGAWCPYCNITLKTYQRDLLPALTERGVTLVAVSPQAPEGSEAAVQAGELGFEVLSDPVNELAAALGIVTEPSPEARSAHTQLGFDVSEHNADDTARIPFPTVVVVDGTGTMRFVDVRTDYTSRTEVGEILEAVQHLP